jgi:prepilin-type processing-associated H-X9-DG protein
LPTISPPYTQHNYAVNYGNTGYFSTGPAAQVPGTPPVVFGGAPFVKSNSPATPVYIRFADITDGLSNTLMFGEVIQGQSTSASAFDVRGLIWWGDGAGFTALLPPNANSGDIIANANYCQTNGDIPCDPVAHSSPNRPANFAARSRHSGGVNVGLCDGSVRFIPNTIAIDTWRAMSTTKGAEVVGEY